jgi:ferritin-like metal-binding protein YciE
MAGAVVQKDDVASLLLREFAMAMSPSRSQPEGNIMEIDSLRKLYVEELKDLHSAERQLVQALPRMAKAASDDQLKAAFEEHLEQTRGQVQRLDQIFERLGKRGTGKKCRGMEGLIEEAKEMMGEDMEPEVLDAALISAAQKVEHYEIAGYGTVRTYAELLGEKEAVRLLQATLDEEAAADKKLTQLAESTINVEAVAAV